MSLISWDAFSRDKIHFPLAKNTVCGCIYKPKLKKSKQEAVESDNIWKADKYIVHTIGQFQKYSVLIGSLF